MHSISIYTELFTGSVKQHGIIGLSSNYALYADLAYQFGGILGASFAPYISQLLVTSGCLSWVGIYMSIAAAISFLAVLALGESKNNQA